MGLSVVADVSPVEYEFLSSGDDSEELEPFLNSSGDDPELEPFLLELELFRDSLYRKLLGFSFSSHLKR